MALYICRLPTKNKRLQQFLDKIIQSHYLLYYNYKHRKAYIKHKLLLSLLKVHS